MKQFSVALLLLMTIAMMYGCTKNVDISAKDPAWERETCTRCIMALDNKHFSAQIVNGQDGKSYYFDDFGCAILWLDEGNIQWKNFAVIYANDATTGQWVNVQNAVLALGYKTPMSFGVAVFKDKSSVAEGKTIITYEQAVQNFKDIIAERRKKKAAQKNDESGVGQMK